MKAAETNTTTSTTGSSFNHHRSQSLPSPHTTAKNTNDLSIFPPINHEGLPVPAPPRAPLSDDSYDQITPLHPPPPPPPPPPNHNIVEDTSQLIKLFKFALRFCNSNLLSFLSRLHSPCFSSPFRLLATTASVFVIVWFWLRRRRRLRCNSLAGGGDKAPSVEHLKGIIKAKDEKIIQLVEQIAQMNKLLLARYGIPVKRPADC